ncbi:MAG: dNTP triphosphohydrolase [Nostoc sp.]|uniref:deoxyguanosinetriphosphate triphosphohydrolase family protein n=1 Tax=Nostoc sp. TaxID=1180 RepID=UPI002FF4D37F
MNYREIRQYNSGKQGDQRRAFQIDRDRLIYSAYFRRLAQVTQVVSASEGNVFHNRLTHSLKVAQVARRLAERLQELNNSNSNLINKYGGLDPDVVEAAAIAHDLGHPPFGHIAEKELDQLARSHGLSDGFEGNAQTFRILTLLEPHRPQYPGLDLTRATLNATLKYPWFCERDNGNTQSKKRSKKYSIYDQDRKAFEFVREVSATGLQNYQQSLEASIMDFADDVTYSVHDLEDFYFAGLIPLETIINNEDEFEKFLNDWVKTISDNKLKEQINESKQKISLKNLLNLYSNKKGDNPGSIEQIAYIKSVSSNLIQNYVQSVSLKEDYGEHGYLERPIKIEIELKFLQRIVWKYVILNPRLATQQYGQRKIIKTLFDVYKEAVETNQVNLIPAHFLQHGSLERLLTTGDQKHQKVRIAVDIVASFSEMEAILMFRRFTGIDHGSVMDYIV